MVTGMKSARSRGTSRRAPGGAPAWRRRGMPDRLRNSSVNERMPRVSTNMAMTRQQRDHAAIVDSLMRASPGMRSPPELRWGDRGAREAGRRGCPPCGWCVASGTPSGSCRSSDVSFVGQLEEHVLEARACLPASGSSMLTWRTQPPALDDDHLVGHLRHLGQQVTRDQHRVPAAANAAGGSRAATGSPAGRARWPARRGRAPSGRPSSAAAKPEALPHAERVPAGLRPAASVQPHHLQHLVDPARRRCRRPRRAPGGGSAPPQRVEALRLRAPRRRRGSGGRGSRTAARARSPSRGRARPARGPSATSCSCRRRSGPGTRSRARGRPRSSGRRPPSPSRTASSVLARRSRVTRSVGRRSAVIVSASSSLLPVVVRAISTLGSGAAGRRRPAVPFSALIRAGGGGVVLTPGWTRPDS